MNNKFKLALGLATTLLLAACSSVATNDQNKTNVIETGYYNGYSLKSLAAGNTLYFAFDSYELDTTSVDLVLAYAKFLTDKSNSILIEGYADERGTPEYNIALGAKRAAAVKDLLLKHGVLENKISVVSYGESRPAVLGSTEQAYSKNRRAVIVVNN